MPFKLIETALDTEFTSCSVTLLTEKIQDAIEDHGRCIMGLSGGSTPRGIYEALPSPSNPLSLRGEGAVDWSKVYLFLVDERYVPKDHPDSNQFLVRSTLLRSAPIPEGNLYFPDTSLPIGKCCALYTAHLKDLFANHLPDIVTLGLGEDGHIASLFPPLSGDLMDDSRLVAHTTTDRFSVHDRITLTLNPIVAAGHAAFFLKGKERKRVWEEMITSGEDERRWPGKRVLDGTDVTVISYWQPKKFS